MSSNVRQSHLREYRSTAIALTDAQRAIVCGVEPESTILLILPYRRPRVDSGDQLELFVDDGNWSRTVDVTEAEELRLDEVAEALAEWDATYWGYDDRAIAEAVSNIYGEVPGSSEVVALAVKRPYP